MTATQPRSRTLRAFGVITAAYERVSGVSGLLRPDPVEVNRRLPLRVTGRTVESEDVVSLRLEPLGSGPLPAWHPGAHLDVELPGGRLRQYSLCGYPDDRDHYRIAVRRIPDGGGGSLAVHRLRVGDGLVVRGPRNAFPLIARDRYLFVAGGIGITPILPMLRAARRRGADWQFVYTGRSRATMPFLAEIAALAADAPERVTIRPDDEFGEPDAAAVAGMVALAPVGTTLYTCGPPPMVDAIRACIPAANVSSLHYERFSAPPVVGGSPFEIELAGTGEVLPVAADESALTALLRARPTVAYSCRQGFCGTCPATVLAGQVEHLDRCLSPAERTSAMAICVSRATGRVVLDL